MSYNKGSDGRAYSHGSCKGNGIPGQAAAGSGHMYGTNRGEGGWGATTVPGHQTNQRAELHAARNALDHMAASGVRDATVRTSSKYVADAMNHGAQQWQSNDWRLASGRPAANQDLLRDTMRSAQQFDNVRFEHQPRGTGGAGEQGARGLSSAAASWNKSGSDYYKKY